MGCVFSKTDINDLHPNIFQVMNLDELGNLVNPGKLEVTETDLVLYQKEKDPVKWPLRCLRRYGFDAELFSFECGRRCPTGPGIYAFSCQRAEQLFNLLQTHIQVRNNAGEDAVSQEFPGFSPQGPAATSRLSTSGDPTYFEPSSRPGLRGNVPNSIRFSSQNGGGSARLGSVGSSSNGPLSPQGTASPSPPPVGIPPVVPILPPCVSSEAFHGPSVVPTDGSKCACKQRVGSGDGITINGAAETTSCTQTNSSSSYMNVDLGAGVEPLSQTCSVDGESSYVHLQLKNDVQRCHLYMNVIPGPENGVPSALDKPSATIRPKPPLPCFGKLKEEWELEEHHCYANLEPGEIEVARNHLPKRLSGPERVPPLPLLSSTIQSQQNPLTPPPGVVQTVNYIELDLDKNKTDLVIGSSNSPQQPKSPIGSVPPSTLSLSPDSPVRASEGYATIDFCKTVALSHSVNPNVDNDSEGCRRTRHNSTINDLVAPLTRLSCSE
ncbi:hypothetical protein Cfor_12566 [Coptotermes formosanus]|uniref:IRS-type PTB domain-containing protein n=1 Tax=Coptotermes formosanus TaxID=36987 RepID=A0A6L2Q252_COPFO|nr:hypothetical protein Cfor_12566 [Coptotermes formosanus]